MLTRSTVLTIVFSLGMALFSFTPTAALWVAIGKEQGYIPAEVPPEATEPPVLAGGFIVLFVSVCVMVFRLLSAWLNRSSGFEAAVAEEAVKERITRGVLHSIPVGTTCIPSADGTWKVNQKVIPPQGGSGTAAPTALAARGMELVANRNRREKLRNDVAAAEAEMADLVRDRDLAKRELAEQRARLMEASIDVANTRRKLEWVESEREGFADTVRLREKHILGIDESLQSLRAATVEFKREERSLL